MNFLFPSPLVKGRLVKRYKRFFADVILDDDTTVTAHCANTGSMKTCGSPGDVVFLLHHQNPNRKLAYTWELTQAPKGYIGVNTARPNQVVKLAVENGLIKELSGYSEVKAEVKYGSNSRIDLYLSAVGKPPCYVEVKNTTLFIEPYVMFPDAVTERGLKHLEDLICEVKNGHRAVMFYFVNRPEGQAFRPAASIDPAYADGLLRATKAGVEVLAYRAVHDLQGITLGERVKYLPL